MKTKRIRTVLGTVLVTGTAALLLAAASAPQQAMRPAAQAGAVANRQAIIKVNVSRKVAEKQRIATIARRVGYSERQAALVADGLVVVQDNAPFRGGP